MLNREFRDLTVEELIRGYIWAEKEEGYSCIFCGEVFEEGVVYPSGPRLLTAEKAARAHVEREHGGSFGCLLDLDKQISGLTEVQRNVLRCFYEGRETEEICESMGISPATVRTHRHNLQKLKREAKIFLALMEQLSAEERTGRSSDAPSAAVIGDVKTAAAQETAGTTGAIPGGFSGNTLHPFFTQKKFD